MPARQTIKIRPSRVREAKCSVPAREAAQLVERVIEHLRSQGFRRTEALAALLTHMALRHRPVTPGELAHSRPLAERDQATIYRLLMKLEEAGVVRRHGLHRRTSHFELIIPGHCHDYLVCKSCGGMAQVDVDHSLETVERQIEAGSGWRRVQHELDFFGVCPECTPNVV
jgi:Fur family ferric uptake transcriptional regulator